MPERRLRRRQLLERLTSPQAIGWPLLVSSFGIFVIDGFPFLGGNELSGSMLDRAGVILQAALIAHLVLAALLLAARFTWLRTKFARRHPSATLSTFFIATLVGDVVFQGAVAAGSAGTYTGASVVGDVLYKTAALTVLTIVIVDLSDYRRRITDLEQQRRSLTAARQEAARLDQLEQSNITTNIEESLAAARDMVASRPPGEAADFLAGLAADRVRPLSHDLSTTPVDFAPPAVEPLPQPGWRAALRTVADAPLIAPGTMAVIMTVLGFRQTVTFEPGTAATSTDGSVAVTFDATLFIESISVLAVIFVATLASTRLVRRFIATRLTASTARRQFVANSVGIIVASQMTLLAVAASFVLPWFPDPPQPEPWTPLLTLVPLSLVAITHGLIRSIDRHRSAVSTGLLDANHNLRWEIASINERLWRRRRERATHVHGPVQAALNAAAHRLRAIAGSDIADAELDETRRSVDSLLAECSADDAAGASAPDDLLWGLAEIETLWRGVCAVDTTVDTTVVESTGPNPTCSSSILTIVGEACANAVQHGGARHAHVHVTALDERTIRVTISDDGNGPKSGSSPGMGARLLDEITLEWSIRHEAGTTTLIADLPRETRA